MGIVLTKGHNAHGYKKSDFPILVLLYINGMWTTAILQYINKTNNRLIKQVKYALI
ncbi:MAG: hypothetical protein M0P00_03360 [Bacteroidaceae bacterium]|nr:hypothetical protein [Bacteroidaceae bacterium]